MKEIALTIIEELKSYKELYVIGHNNIDSDSFFSSYLLSVILQSFQIPAKFCMLEDYQILEEDKKEILDFKIEDPIILRREDCQDKYFLLVDHNDPEQSLKEGNGKIVLSIDHHIITGKVKNCYSEEYTSTGLFLYALFKDIYPFSKIQKEIIALTVMADSCFLTTSRFKESDRILLEELNTKLDATEMRRKYFHTTDFSKEKDFNIKNNHKVYHLENLEINRVILKGYQEDKKYLEEYLIRSNELYSNNLFIWNEFDTLHTYVYYKGRFLKEYDKIVTSSMLITKDLLAEIKNIEG